jgi:HAD superfamily hydrolase (TIGR01484 family)
MRYLVLATDYDGTIAAHGAVSASTVEALERARASGRKLVLVTGRELEDLFSVFPQYALFDRIVAENGALLYRPDTREEKLLGERPPAELVEQLRARGVDPLSVGRVIVATREPNEHAVLEAIRALGLEQQVIFNKGAVMVLPSGINKATGLSAALAELRLSAHNTVAVGDAENDHALLSHAELGVAVANALPMLKERADWVTSGARGAGVEELIQELVEDDLRRFEARLTRAELQLGTRSDGAPLTVHTYGRRLLVCGTSGSGKSTLTTSFLEQLVEAKYQFCLIDPEGDYGTMDGAVVVGNEQQPPSADEVLDLLTTNENSVIVNLLGIKLEERPQFFTALFARLGEYRARFGRPHWIIVDEAHHMIPQGEVALPEFVAHPPSGLLMITVHPEHVATSVLESVDTLMVVGQEPAETLAGFARARGVEPPAVGRQPLATGQALYWQPGLPGELVPFQVAPPRVERRRHNRKYAAGVLGEDKSFYFRGPRERLNLRAQNLSLFTQLADGVDDETWLYHLGKGDYSRWLRESIKNDALAREVETIEREGKKDARASRERVRSAIERVYTLPA